MSTPAPLDPAHFSLGKHGHPVQNGEIFFASKSVGECITAVRIIFSRINLVGRRNKWSMGKIEISNFSVVFDSNTTVFEWNLA